MKFFVGIGISLIFLIYIIFGPVFLVKDIRETYFYLIEMNNTIQVRATVVDIEESSASDGGSEYDIYLSYQYNDESYNNIYWKSVSFEDTYSLNDNVNVEIFKSKPDDIVNTGSANYFGWIFPLFITIIGPLAVIKTFFPDFTLVKKKNS